MDALHSLRSQDLGDYEHIIITGPQGESCVRKVADEKTVVVVMAEDLGPGHAMNAGIEVARGQVLGFLFTDDFYSSSTIFSEVHRHFCVHEQTDVIHGNLNIIARESKDVLYPNWRGHAWGMGFGMGLNLPTFFIRRKILLEQKFDTSIQYADDYDLALGLILKGRRFKHFNRPYVNFRRGGRSETVAKHILRKEMREIRAKYFSVPTRQLYYLFGLLMTVFFRLEQNWGRR